MTSTARTDWRAITRRSTSRTVELRPCGLPCPHLIVTVAVLQSQYPLVKPYLVNNDHARKKRCNPKRSRQTRRTIRVHPVRLLFDRCPSFWWNPTSSRPADAAAYRFLADSRDLAASDASTPGDPYRLSLSSDQNLTSVRRPQPDAAIARSRN